MSLLPNALQAPNFTGMMSGPPAPAMTPPAPLPAPAPAPSFQTPPPMPQLQFQRAPALPGRGGDIASLLAQIPAMLMSIKDPLQAGALMAGIQQGRDRVRARQENAQQTQDRRMREGAEFYSRAIASLSEIDDPIAHEQAKQALAPMAQYYQVDLSPIQFSDQKRAAKDRKLATDALARAEKEHGLGVLNNGKYVIGLDDGRMVDIATALAMRGGGVKDEQGKAIPIVTEKPFATTSPDDLKIAAHAKVLGKAVADLTPQEIADAVNVGKPAKDNAPNVGSFEDYTIRYAKEHGKDPAALTPADIQAARKAYNQSDDRPININQGSGKKLTLATQKANKFDALPLVKNTQKMAEAASFAQGLDANTKNPADDQALIYAFAKAMDPDSVVREGEYATVQKYAQSWAQSFGFNAARLFSNTTFLTPEARANMKATIMAKFHAGRTQYENMRRSYVEQINKITGEADGEDYLSDYGGAFPTEPGAPGGGIVKMKAPDGQTKDVPADQVEHYKGLGAVVVK